MKKWTLVVVAVASMSLLAAACSSNDSTSDTSTDTSVSASAAPTQTNPEIASGNEDFSTLVAAIEAAGLGETLSGEGPFTVFAPTNDAFDALPEGTLDTLLLPKNKEQLAGILT